MSTVAPLDAMESAEQIVRIHASTFADKCERHLKDTLEAQPGDDVVVIPRHVHLSNVNEGKAIAWECIACRALEMLSESEVKSVLQGVRLGLRVKG